ncbi:nucleoside triphosphate hydrolase [Kiloniella spongiae]|uniref:Nucleoside triphosphate pyrophosphohydrolase n=1 Tax=Kiloniella spongiae TaxID=1489064 RepID=A0A0H2MX78_9PROT|nr:nucleoside triphosphate pyrophosphohydrolase [Kiloniella spongiae]KLN61330.1 nucleoside triphosphate hydrolase [Kiloniella spongiae]
MTKQIPDTTKNGISRLIDLMKDLRDPDGGCPWDIEQTFRTIAPYTIEEAYEVADAIEKNDPASLKDELGDLLLQVVYHAQIAKDENLFDFESVAQAITEKMINRHPHVYAEISHDNVEEQKLAWEELKAKERENKRGKKEESVLDGITIGLPAATRAIKLQNRAAKVGFDWPNLSPVIDKVYEEIDELKDVLQSDQHDNTLDKHDRAEDELGDILFSVVNLARHLDIDPEQALRRTNQKFENRFRTVEKTIKENGLNIKNTSLEYMENIWILSKENE